MCVSILINYKLRHLIGYIGKDFHFKSHRITLGNTFVRVCMCMCVSEHPNIFQNTRVFSVSFPLLNYPCY